MAKISPSFSAQHLDSLFQRLWDSVKDAGPLVCVEARQWDDHKHRRWMLEFDFALKARMPGPVRVEQTVKVTVPIRDAMNPDPNRARIIVHDKVKEDMARYIDTGQGDVVLFDEVRTDGETGTLWFRSDIVRA